MSARSFFTPLLEWDPSGRQWLGPLLQAAPRGRERLGAELVEQPGSLSMSLSVRGVSGTLGAFEYPLAPGRALTSWLVEHPESLQWVDQPDSPQTVTLRRALVFDDPPGSRARAQDRARELMRSRSVLSQEWWRFEELDTIECLLMTDRLVVTVLTDAVDPRAPVTPWFPGRTRLTKAIEAARELSADRAWGCLLLSDDASLELRDGALGEPALAAGAPHLAPDERTQLRDAYLGRLSWPAATAAIQRTSGPASSSASP